MKCSECGDEMQAKAPLSNMGEKMYGRGVDDYVCWNPRCSRFGRKVRAFYGMKKRRQ